MSQAQLKLAVVLLGVAAAWALPFVIFTPGDFVGFLDPWYRHIIHAGIVSAFSRPFGNYSPPYLYLLAAISPLDGHVPHLVAIKLLSTAGAAWLAYAIFKLLQSCEIPAAVEAAAWSLVLPTMVLNVPLLAQADTFWVAPSVLAVAASVKGRPVECAVWASVAFAFKAQAIFIGPFVTLVLVRQRAPWWTWLIPVAVYLIAITPAWLAGWPLADLLTIYVRQAQWQPPGERFISTAPNMWMLVKLYAPQLHSTFVGIFLAGATALAYLILLRKLRADATSIVATAALSGALIPFVLPGMHERFFALSEILTFCLAWIDRRTIAIAIASQAAFLLNAGGMLGGPPILFLAGVVAEAAVILLLIPVARNQFIGNLGERSPCAHESAA